MENTCTTPDCGGVYRDAMQCSDVMSSVVYCIVIVTKYSLADCQSMPTVSNALECEKQISMLGCELFLTWFTQLSFWQTTFITCKIMICAKNNSFSNEVDCQKLQLSEKLHCFSGSTSGHGFISFSEIFQTEENFDSVLCAFSLQIFVFSLFDQQQEPPIKLSNWDFFTKIIVTMNQTVQQFWNLTKNLTWEILLGVPVVWLHNTGCSQSIARTTSKCRCEIAETRCPQHTVEIAGVHHSSLHAFYIHINKKEVISWTREWIFWL